ncbi:MAG: putative bifunctional diguanylate cyclase/phosphodiesterase [Aquimonas sp.]
MASWNGAEDVDPEAGGLSGVESVSSPQAVGVGEVLLRGLETLSHSRAWLRLDLRREGDAELRAEARLPGLALSDGCALGGGGRVQWTLDGLPGSPFHLELSWAEGPPPGHSEQQALERVLRAGLPAALEVDRLQSALARLADAERLQRALFSIAELASAEGDTGELIAGVHGILAGLMYAENFFIALVDSERDVLTFPYFRDSVDTEGPPIGAPIPRAEYRGSLTDQVFSQGRSLMGAPVELLREAGLPERPSGFGPLSLDWLGVPLTRGGDVFGVVVVQSYDPEHRYSDRERALLGYVAQHIANALERRQVHDELERRVAQRTDELRYANEALRAEIEERQRADRLQAALFRIAELGSSGGSLEDFFGAVHRVIGQLLFADNFYIALHDPERGEISFPYSVDQYDRQRPTRRLARGMTEYVLRTGRPVLIDRSGIDQLASRGEVESLGAQAQIWLGVPLTCASTTVGVLAVQSYDDARGYQNRDQELLTFVSYHVANALERKRATDSLRLAYAELERRVEQRTEALFEANRDLRQQITERERIEWQLKHAALHDALTGLPNRSYLMSRLDEALQRYALNRNDCFAVLFLDLDRFKVVNDSVGHLVGDELLKEAGARIAASVGRRGTIARLGGDEFAILIEGVEAEAQASEAAGRIIEAMELPIRAGGKELYSSVSIGIALAQPHYRTAAELLRDADVALYRAKANGRRRFELFDEALRREALLQLELEGNLRRALVRSEFEPVFQPILDLENGGIAGYEALLRWRHPQRGLLAPSDFLGQAEESGLLEAIDWQIYELVFAQAWQLVAEGGYVSINVGARHLRSAQFVPELARLLARYELPPQRLRIEVTERSLFEQPELARELFRELRALGVSLALDDFGTGYSSLSYLHQFPLQVLKIDRSFVEAADEAEPGNALAVLRAICALGSSLGMEVVAEGIESSAQLERVRDLGCRYGQGFLLGVPQPVCLLVPGARPAAELQPGASPIEPGARAAS